MMRNIFCWGIHYSHEYVRHCIGFLIFVNIYSSSYRKKLLNESFGVLFFRHCV